LPHRLVQQILDPPRTGKQGLPAGLLDREALNRPAPVAVLAEQADVECEGLRRAAGRREGITAAGTEANMDLKPTRHGLCQPQPLPSDGHVDALSRSLRQARTTQLEHGVEQSRMQKKAGLLRKTPKEHLPKGLARRNAK
jgi:hypothetical protein